MPQELKDKIALLPTLSGVYQFFDNKGVIIYVGKAKNLRYRVSSYFNNAADHSPKVRALVRVIVDLKHIVVDDAQEALLLENTLIKLHKPRYNIMLKDSKTYPWICISNEPFPRIFSTRNLVKDGSVYYGPYSNITMQRAVLELIRGLYPLRSCKYFLTPKTIAQGTYSICLEYHIGNCLGPCEGRVSAEDYAVYISHARDILKGELAPAADFFTSQMEWASGQLKFEEAQRNYKNLQLLNDYRHRSIIVSPTLTNLDVVYMMVDDNVSYCNHIKVVKGAIVSSYSFELKSFLDETPAQMLDFALNRIENLHEVIVPFKAAEYEHCIVPQRGDKLKLLELAEKNCKLYRLDKFKSIERTDPDKHIERVMELMRKDLKISLQPRHIECFDNSNIQGSSPVAACVVFRDGRPSKKDYRHFNIKSVVGSNDFASMEEVVFRRYSRMIEEQQSLPQLVIIDGGKGQLGAAIKAFERLGTWIPVIGLAKRMEEIYFPGDPTPYYLDKTGETLRTIMFLRDEAHRFGITFHRQKRSIAFIKSELENVPKLGKASIEKLLKQYRTIERIKKAPREELEELIGRNRTQELIDYFA